MNKKIVFEHCTGFVNNRLELLTQEIAKINESLLSETKSSAGDKHETGRAMLQLEREKLGKQLQQVEQMQLVLNRLAADSPATQKIALGSLVQTDKAFYYISVSAGQVTIEGKVVFCISVGTPIGKLLLGKSARILLTLMVKYNRFLRFTNQIYLLGFAFFSACLFLLFKRFSIAAFEGLVAFLGFCFFKADFIKSINRCVTNSLFLC